MSQEPLLCVGQRIIEVNDASLLGASHAEAVSALREAGSLIKLLVCDGWNDPTGPPVFPELSSNGHHDDDEAAVEDETTIDVPDNTSEYVVGAGEPSCSTSTPSHPPSSDNKNYQKEQVRDTMHIRVDSNTI